jgi:hypothetical protein
LYCTKEEVMVNSTWWADIQNMYRGTGWNIFPEREGVALMYNMNTKEKREIAVGCSLDIEVGSEVEVFRGKFKGERGVVNRINGSLFHLNLPSGGTGGFSQGLLMLLPPRLGSAEKLQFPKYFRDACMIPSSVSWHNYMLPDVGVDGVDAVSEDDMNEGVAPCRCPSMLEGHIKSCPHYPPIPEEERERAAERERLENVWAIPKPREPLSYKTHRDMLGPVHYKFNLSGGSPSHGSGGNK